MLDVRTGALSGLAIALTAGLIGHFADLHLWAVIALAIVLIILVMLGFAVVELRQDRGGPGDHSPA